MTINATPIQLSAGTGGSVSAGPTPLTALPAAGTLMVSTAHWGNSTNTKPTIGGTYTDWVERYSGFGGAGAWGSGTGPRGVTIWTRVADGTETLADTVSWSQVAGDGQSTMRCQPVIGYTNSTGLWSIPSVVGGSDTTSGTGYSAAGGSNPAATVGDVLLLATSIAGNPTQSAGSMTFTGVTPVAITLDAGANGAAGFLVRGIRYYTNGPFTAGPSTAAPTHAMTLSAAAGGHTGFMVIREAGRERRPRVVNSEAAQRASRW